MSSSVKIIVSKTVLDGGQINILHRFEDYWIGISKQEKLEQIQNLEDNFYIIGEEVLFEKIPSLRGKLDQPTNTTINIDYQTGEVNINKKHFHLGIPTHGPQAMRQANVDFSLLKWIYTNKSSYRNFLKISAALLLCAWIFGWFFYILFGLYLIYQLLALLKERDMFKSGALCPGIVVDVENSKIAVLTDMSLGMGSYPIIRIKKVNLPSKYRKIGKRIPVAGMYQNTEKYTHWNFFKPLPIPSATKNEAIISEKLSAIPTIEWINLRTEIKKLNHIPLEGYYPIEIEKSSWKDIDLTSIKWMQFGEEKASTTQENN